MHKKRENDASEKGSLDRHVQTHSLFVLITTMQNLKEREGDMMKRYIQSETMYRMYSHSGENYLANVDVVDMAHPQIMHGDVETV